MCRVLDNSLYIKDRKKYTKISEMEIGTLLII